MGVYINMDMPTRCGRCDMCVKEVDGDIDYHYECCITAARIDNLGEKMDDCPLVHVPLHGRLIDADALYSHIKDEQRKCNDPYDGWSECQVALGFVNTAPTIIPAEEGER